MDKSLIAIKAQMDMHTRWFNNALTGITDDEAHNRYEGRLVHLKWVAGHLLHIRLTSMSGIAGLPAEGKYKELFARGVALADVTMYPSLADILEQWQTVSAALDDAILQLPEEKLATVTPAQVPISDNTVRGTLTFLLSHEAFHIGQLSMLRQMIGKEAMAYG